MSLAGESVHLPGSLAKLRVAVVPEPSIASVGDYLALMKPRVMSRAAGDGASGEQAAKHLFAFSVLYLFLLFAVLLVEQGIGLPSHALFR